MQDDPCGGLTPDEVAQILSLVERSDFDSIDVTLDNVLIFASKTADNAPSGTSATPHQAKGHAPAAQPMKETVSFDAETGEAAVVE